MTPQPFRIDVSQQVLDDLDQRLASARIVKGVDGSNWDYGTSPDYLRSLTDYWRSGFDWRAAETRLNAFQHFRSTIDGVGLHFIHEKGEGSDAIPLLLIHGWPDSFFRYLKLIPRLTHPSAYEAKGQPSFDVIVPSLPGFGFSDKPTRKNQTFEYGDLLHELMADELGYKQYAVGGGDWGGTITEMMARSHAGSLIGIHLTDVPFGHLFEKHDDLSDVEKKYVKKMQSFPQTEGAYALIQSTKPLSLAQGLNDSPAGLAAWIIEKFRAWSDCDGNVEKSFSRDELLTNIMIYWATQTIDSSFLPYYDRANAGALRWTSEAMKTMLGSKRVPAALALFPKDIGTPPREWAERFFNVQRWTEMPRGGHFAALEEPDLYVRDLRETFGPLWSKK